MNDAWITSPLALATLIAATAALAFWLDRAVPALGKLGASMMAIIFGAILSNLGVVPAASPVYDVVIGPVTSVSIALLLLSVDLRDLARAGARMLAAFAIAVAGTTLGAFTAAILYADRFPDDIWRIAGALTGTYSGGSVNFISVGREVGLSGALFAGLNAADAVVTGLWLGATLLLPLWIGRFYAPVAAPVDAAPVAAASADAGAASPAATDVRTDDPAHKAPAVAAAAQDERERHHPYIAREPMSAVGIAGLLAAGLILVAASEWLAGVFPRIPGIVWLTTLALIAGHTPPCRDMKGALQLGSVGLHFFFVLIGIFSRLSEIAEVGFDILYLTLLVVGVHAVVVLGAGRIFRLDIGTVAVASQAAVGGPSSALAVAVAREWRHLVLPGVIMGLAGYAVGTYLGLGVAGVLR